MVKRKYANYLDGVPVDPVDPDETDPNRPGTWPTRAWLQRSEDLVDDEDTSLDDDDTPWAMTLELGKAGADNHEGEFDDLVDLARRAGVAEFHVWSTRGNGFVEFTDATVHPLD